MFKHKFNLQLFAQAGDVVNATDGFYNSSTGNKTEFGNGYDLSPTIKMFYDTELLENARVQMFYAQFGKRQPLPAGNGDTLEWRKWNTFARAGKLVEGVIPTGQKFGMSKITGSVDQYGTYTALSDRIQMEAYDPIVTGATEEMGASAAETQEALTRDGLLVGTNVLYADNITLADGTVADTPTRPAGMHASPTVLCKFTADTVARAVTIMKKNRVPQINGKYYAVIHPSVAYDLRKDQSWIEVHKYAATSEIFNGEIGELHGCRFIEDTFAPVLRKSYVNAESTSTYATYMFGKDSFGIVDPEGGGMEMIVKPKGTIGGPLEQFSTIGYKLMTNGATILYQERLLRIMSCSSFSAIDLEN